MRFRPTARGLLVPLAAIGAGLFLVACADHLPDQDLRILQTTSVAKLSTDILWSEYQTDKKAADRKYRGKAIEVSGKVSSVVPESPARLMFLPLKESTAGVEARLLDDQAKAGLATAAAEHVTLRCFCEGLATNVVLKSCVKR